MFYAEMWHYRAIQGQVDDQDVYCRFGLKWCSSTNDFVVDSCGCQAIVKYGKSGECLIFKFKNM